MNVEEKLAQEFADGTLELLRLTLLESAEVEGFTQDQASNLQKALASQTLRIHVATLLATIDVDENKTIDELTEIYRETLIETRQNYLTSVAATELANSLG